MKFPIGFAFNDASKYRDGVDGTTEGRTGKEFGAGVFSGAKSDAYIFQRSV